MSNMASKPKSILAHHASPIPPSWSPITPAAAGPSTRTSSTTTPVIPKEVSFNRHPRQFPLRGSGYMYQGMGHALAKRHRQVNSHPPHTTPLTPHFRKLNSDNILGITKPAIRRLARRGGVTRISAEIYEDARQAIKSRLTEILRQITLVMDSSSTRKNRRKTITTNDVIYVLKRLGTPIYGFDQNKMQKKLTIR